MPSGARQQRIDIQFNNQLLKLIIEMKRIVFCLIGLINLLGVVSCDKIDPDNYTVYAGAPLAWEQDVAFDAVQRAYVDKYTGPKCTNCPLADATLDAAHHQFGDKLVVVSINHHTGQGIPFPDQPDLRTDEGTTWDKYFGINGIPAAYLNRNTATQYSGSMDNITADISSVIGTNPVVGVEVTADDSDGDGTVEIMARVYFKQSYTKPVTLTLAMTEDLLAYKQSMPDGTVQDDYVHNHMLRDVITDVWGADIDCTGAAGEARQTTVSYTVSDQSVNLANCNIVAFVSDKSSRRVLNCAQTKITMND